MSETLMTSRKPYFLRAMHEWISENGMTPYIVVDASIQGVQIPREFVQDGKIILNISYTAANALQLGNDWVMFDARFSGKAFNVALPCQSILAVYAQETGEVFVFDEEENLNPDPQPTPPEPPKIDKSQSKEETSKPTTTAVKKGKPTLRVVK